MKYKRPLLFALLILAASTASSGDIDRIGLPPIMHLDKAVHMTMYLVLTMSLLKSTAPETGRHSIFLKAACAVAAVVFGAGMEWVQLSFTADRHFELLDIAANTAGALAAVIILPAIKKTFLYRLI